MLTSLPPMARNQEFPGPLAAICHKGMGGWVLCLRMLRHKLSPSQLVGDQVVLASVKHAARVIFH